MALKRNFQTLDTFSMSSMTDVIFLLLIFFMVTSTLVFPAAIDVNLPQSSQQSSEKPTTEVYLDADSRLWLVVDSKGEEGNLSTPQRVSKEELKAKLLLLQQNDSLSSVALYADSTVAYARVVEVLEMASKNDIRLVLATQSTQQ